MLKAKRFLLLATALAGALFLSACVSTEQETNDLWLQVAVTSTTQKVIESKSNHAERAAKILAFATDAKSLINGTSVEVPQLEDAVRERMISQNLSGPELALASALVRAISLDLARRVGGDQISSGHLIAVDRVLDLVILAASSYLPKQET